MVVGMGTVYIFLFIMIGIMNLLTILMKPLARLIPEEEEKIETKVKKAVVESHEDIAIAFAAVRSFVK
jgi:Na+-transporting methylmalonyl-CoA/oxaloacetate decarboxylase gamma subunit